MMGKLVFILWSELGSIPVNQKVGMIYGERKILPQKKYILGGIQ
jgi:hypothetical protein